MKSAVPPWRISACLVAHSVIELPAGTVQRTHTSRGDRLEVSAALPEGELHTQEGGAHALRTGKFGRASAHETKKFSPPV